MSRVVWDTRFISRAYYVRIIGDKKRKKKDTEKDSYIVLVRKRTVVESRTHVGAATL